MPLGIPFSFSLQLVLTLAGCLSVVKPFIVNGDRDSTTIATKKENGGSTSVILHAERNTETRRVRKSIALKISAMHISNKYKKQRKIRSVIRREIRRCGELVT